MVAQEDAKTLACVAAQAADEKLADDVVVIDVSDELAITDCFVIVSAANDRQANAIVGAIQERLHEVGAKPARREGDRNDRWILLDYVDVVVHVQHSQERQFYGLDRLWHDCPRINWNHTVSGGSQSENIQAQDLASLDNK